MKPERALATWIVVGLIIFLAFVGSHTVFEAAFLGIVGGGASFFVIGALAWFADWLRDRQT